MNIKGLNKATVLAALFNASKVQGMGFLDPNSNNQMTEVEAQSHLDESEDKYFDYLNGRVMKISLKNDEVDTWLYNRDNGENAAEAVIGKLL